jgi:hypothetical protein
LRSGNRTLAATCSRGLDCLNWSGEVPAMQFRLCLTITLSCTASHYTSIFITIDQFVSGILGKKIHTSSKKLIVIDDT